MELGGFEPPTSWVRFNVSPSTGTLTFGFVARKAGPSGWNKGIADSYR
jgi:hypothetical protein